MNLNLLDEKPLFSATSILTIDALAPLSIVAKMPGKYYRSQSSPTNEMLYGLLENALGWHISEKDRNELIKKLQKKHGKTAEASGTGFKSVFAVSLAFWSGSGNCAGSGIAIRRLLVAASANGWLRVFWRKPRA